MAGSPVMSVVAQWHIFLVMLSIMRISLLKSFSAVKVFSCSSAHEHVYCKCTHLHFNQCCFKVLLATFIILFSMLPWLRCDSRTTCPYCLWPSIASKQATIFSRPYIFHRRLETNNTDYMMVTHVYYYHGISRQGNTNTRIYKRLLSVSFIKSTLKVVVSLWL